MAQEILIIRHGETTSNAARIVQTPDIPLSDRGRDQARRLAKRLAIDGVDRILASDHVRARMTAEAVRAATDAPLDLDPLLQERSFGDIRGTRYSDLGGQDIFAPDFAPPGGETGAVFDVRVDAAWSSIRSRAERVPGRFVVVTHGLVCASLAARHLRLEGAVVAASWQNTSVTAVEGAPPWRVLRVNCTEHLDDTPGAGGVV